VPDLHATGPRRRHLIEIIAKRPEGISRIDLMNILYADDEAGGPDCAGTVSMRSLYKQTIAA
jgi:hypothetical protein